MNKFQEQVKVNVLTCLSNAHNAAVDKVDRLIKSGCVDERIADMVTAKALAAALLEEEISQMNPRGTSHARRFSSEKRNASCFV